MGSVDLGLAYDDKGRLRHFLDFAYPNFKRKRKTTRATLGGKVEIFWVDGTSAMLPVGHVKRWPRGSSADINLQKDLDLPANLYKME